MRSGAKELAAAKRLYEDAPALTCKELRRLGRLYLRAEWATSAKKSQIVRGFREALAKEIRLFDATWSPDGEQ